MKHMTKAAESKAKATKKCIGCFKKNAKSPRAQFCIGCFKKNAKSANLKRKVRGGGGGVIGKRSALRRSTKMLLVVKKPWLDLILSRKRSWEIRDAQTKQRGKIHLALSGAGGRIVGQCHITDPFAIDKCKLENHFSKHRIRDLALITYRRPHVWVLSKARRYKTPFVYSHPQGAIQWVKL